MEIKEAQIKFISMDSTEALKDYVFKKLSKVDNFLERAVKAEIILKESVHKRGVDKDFRVDINISLPKSLVIVQEEGEDIYALIDKSVDILTRRLKRYYDKLSQWEGKTPWKVLEAEEALAEYESTVEEDDYSDYIPKITVHKKVEDMRPLEDAEAIEEMELKGFNQLLFKSKRDKYCMVYKRNDGTYGLVEPMDNVLD